MGSERLGVTGGFRGELRFAGIAWVGFAKLAGVIAVARACSTQIRIPEIAGGVGIGVTVVEAEGCSRRCSRVTERACWRVWRLWRCSWLMVWVECLMN